MLGWRKVKDQSLFARPSALGLVLGGLLFAAALTPSLIPRTAALQGVLAGLCFSAGYGLGFFLVTFWHWLFEGWRGRGVEAGDDRGPTWALGVAGVVAGASMIWALTQVTGWQNDIHAAMHMPAVESARPLTIFAIAAALSVVLVFLGRVFRRVWLIIAAQLERFAPRRVARFVALGAALSLVAVIGNDMLVGRVLAMLDRSYAALDKLMPTDGEAPLDPQVVGAPQSLIDWDDLGAEGRHWVSAPLNADRISALTGRAAKTPLRVYVGLNSAETATARAQLALEEARRLGAFSRKVLVLAMPTGTGWMDPAGLGPLSVLTDGDVATIAVQYSYLPSWLSLFLQPEYGAETAQAVFREFYKHWQALPEDTRPQLYLFGLSLGARNGEIPIRWPDLLSDPMAGALWVGPPFAMRGWQETLAEREPDSPAWAARYGRGEAVRVQLQAGAPHPEGPPLAPWGVMRMVYLAYPSDPIAYFSTNILWREPDWLAGSRGADVSPSLRWWPLVTFLQLGFDMMTATTTPAGYGHVYAARDYLMAWDEVLARGTSAEDMARYKEYFTRQGL